MHLRSEVLPKSGDCLNETAIPAKKPPNQAASRNAASAYRLSPTVMVTSTPAVMAAMAVAAMSKNDRAVGIADQLVC